MGGSVRFSEGRSSSPGRSLSASVFPVGTTLRSSSSDQASMFTTESFFRYGVMAVFLPPSAAWFLKTW